MLSFLCIDLVDIARTNEKKGGRKLDIEICFLKSEEFVMKFGCIWVHRLLRFAKYIWLFSQYFHVALTTIKLIRVINARN